MKKHTTNGLRWLFALLFLTTAVGKLLDNRGFATVLETYQLFPSFGLLPLALFISLAELILGLWFSSGKYLTHAAWTSVVVNSGYALLAVVTNLRGLILPNCGCFGVFLPRAMTWGTVAEDFFLVGLGIGLARLTASNRAISASSEPKIAWETPKIAARQ